MDVGAAVVADEQALELVQPGEGAFDDPAGAAEAGAVVGLAAGDLGRDRALPEQAPVLVVVVAAVGAETRWPAARGADQPAHRRHPVEQRDQLGDIVAVAAGERPGERDPAGVDQEVVLGAASAAIDRARAGLSDSLCRRGLS